MTVLLFFGYAGLVGLLLGAYALGQYALWRYWRQLPIFSLPDDFSPRTALTILLPARNEAAHLAAALDDLLAQRYPSSLLEIIVIDDHSSDATATIAAAYAERGVRLLQLADQLQGRPVLAYKKAALEYGVARAKGAWVVTTDADCRFPPEWLRTLSFAIETDRYDLLCAPVRIALAQPLTLLTAFQGLDLAGYMLLTGATVQAGRPLLANGANLAFRRELFDRIDGYAGLHDRASGDDVLLLHKVVRREGPARIGFVSALAATVDTRPMTGWPDLWRQRLRWAGKTGGYQDRLLVAIQAVVYLLCLAILAGLAGLVFRYGIAFAGLATLAWLGKAAVDRWQLRWLSHYFGRPEWLSYYWPVQLLYPFYLVAVGTVALFRPRVGWKDRSIR